MQWFCPCIYFQPIPSTHLVHTMRNVFTKPAWNRGGQLKFGMDVENLKKFNGRSKIINEQFFTPREDLQCLIILDGIAELHW